MKTMVVGAFRYVMNGKIALKRLRNGRQTAGITTRFLLIELM